MSDAAETHWARPILERQLALLGRLAEIGLAVAEDIQAEKTGGSESPALAFSRVSRAVRLTVMLQSRLIEEIDAKDADADIAAGNARFLRSEAHKARVERIVERVAQDRDEDVLDRLIVEAGERLDDQDLYGDVLTKPVGELVARICADLGLDADWARLAEEEWARAEAGDPRSPFAPTSPIAAAMAAGGPLAAEPAVEGAGGRQSSAPAFIQNSA